MGIRQATTRKSYVKPTELTTENRDKPKKKKKGHRMKRMKYSSKIRQKTKSKVLRSDWYEHKGLVRTGITENLWGMVSLLSRSELL